MKSRYGTAAGFGCALGLALTLVGCAATGNDETAQLRPDAPPAWAMERNNNRVLQGNFAPITDEPTITGLEVKGTLPPELDGIYMRSGPNQRLRPYDGPDGMHWFDGDGMVHYVRFCGPGSKPEYGARYIRTRGFKEEEAVGHPLYCSIQDNPILECCKRGLGSKLRHFFSPDAPWWVMQNKNTANNAIVYHAGKLMALYEVAMPYPVSIREAMDGTLDFNTAEEAYTFDGALNGWLDNFTAHPKIDPETGEMMFIGYNLVGKSLKVAVVSAEGKIVNQHWMTYAIPQRSTLMHDMAITATRTILLDQPLQFDMMKSIRELGRPFTFDASQPSFFGVMPRHGGRDDMVWIPFNAGYCFHVINAYDHPDNPDRVVVVALRMAATNAVGMADLEGCEEEDLHQAGHLHLWEMDIPNRQLVQDRQLDWQSLEYPCINPLFEGRPFRYSFLCQVEDGTADPGPPLFNAIVRYDLETGKSRRYLLPEDHACGDLTFVPRNANQASDECDGFVLSYVHNLRDGTTALVVLDAARVEEGPVAEVLIPRRVPFGFHCTYTGPEVVHQS